MIQQTIERLHGLDFISSPLVICNEHHLKLVKSQLKTVGALKRPVMLEPIGRNTAPAIAAAALYCRENENDGLMLVLPSDHTILNIPAFQKAVTAASKAAQAGRYALFGIVPDSPATGYGYIETAASAGTAAESVNTVTAFKEKPDLATAQNYVAQKNYFWNSGMFVIPADLFLKEMAAMEPEMLALVQKSYQNAETDKDCIRLEKSSFAAIQGNSIDYAVMEKTKNAVVIPLDAGWSDVGSWDMVWELSKKDKNANVTNNMAFCEDASGNMIHTAENKPVALLGIKNCIIIESKDGLLIADKKYVQEVKKAAEKFIKK